MDEEKKRELLRGFSYEKFRRLAAEPALSPNERVGFFDHLREGRDVGILADILAKVPPLRQLGAKVADIGCGSSALVQRLIEHCGEQEQTLLLVDSPEMLAHLPDSDHVHKLPGCFPAESRELLDGWAGQLDTVIAYSVLQVVFTEANPFTFVDRALTLLAPGGHLLIGDLPNVSKQRRFFSSEAGRRFHREANDTDEDPVVEHLRLAHDSFDDSTLLGLLGRCREAGFDAYILPQTPGLPMANRREDLLVVRP